MDIYQDHVEGALRELADEDEQRRLWLSDGSGGSEVSSFAECAERLFTDSGLGDELEKSGVVYTQPIDDRLTLLRVALRRIDSAAHPNALLDDPSMRDLRVQAREILRLLNEFRYREPST